jgi:hypothetical protein
MTNEIPVTEVVCVKASYFKILVRALREEIFVGGGANEIPKQPVDAALYRPRQLRYSILCRELKRLLQLVVFEERVRLGMVWRLMYEFYHD